MIEKFIIAREFRSFNLICIEKDMWINLDVDSIMDTSTKNALEKKIFVWLTIVKVFKNFVQIVC